jgi:hypothetical protein
MSYSELEMEARGTEVILVLVYNNTERHIPRDNFRCQSELHISLVHELAYGTVLISETLYFDTT